MEKIFAVIGMIVCLAVAWALSKNKKEINWKSVGCAFFGQIILAFILIKTPLWKCVEWVATGVTWLTSKATVGIEFVFGGLSSNFVFFINSLLPIVFISAIIGVLFHYGIIQKFIGGVGKVVARVLKVDTLVAVNGVTNMFLGQTDALFMTKAYLPKASDSVIFATLVGGMTSISVSVISLYASFGASVEWIIASMPLTVFSTFALTQILMPTKYTKVEEIEIDTTDKGVNVVDTMMNYANGGFKAVIGITVSLLVFLSMVALINGLIGLVAPSFSLERILGILFTPFAVVMGVPKADVSLASQILATKLITNEAVAFGLPQFAMLGIKAKAMMTTALCGFAGIGSIGMLMGGYMAIAPDKVKVVAKLGVKALLTATAVNMLTGCVVGIML